MVNPETIQPYDWRSMKPLEAQEGRYTLRVIATGPTRLAMSTSWDGGAKGFVQKIRPTLLSSGRFVGSFMGRSSRMHPRARPGTTPDEITGAEQFTVFSGFSKQVFNAAMATHYAFQTVEQWRTAALAGVDGEDLEVLWKASQAAVAAMEIEAPDVEPPVPRDDTVALPHRQ